MRPRVWRAAQQMFARKHMLRWLTTPYRQPDPLPDSAKICPIKSNHFSTEPSSNDRLAEALRTRNPRWTTRALWYPPAPSQLYTLAATGKRVDHSNQHGGYRLHIRSRCAPQHLCHIRFACVPSLIPAFGLPHGCADLGRQGRPPFVLVTRRTHLDGWQGTLAGQRVRGASLTRPQAGGGLSTCIRDGGRGREAHCRLPALLQRGTPAPGT